MTKEREGLFEISPEWEAAWEGMPDFKQEDLTSFDSIIVHFRNSEDRKNFLTMLGESPKRRKSIWYPKMEYLKQSRRSDGQSVPVGKYPIYIISKGRWENPLTIKALEKLGLPFFVVVEPSEYKPYRKILHGENRRNVLVLPFENLGQGSIPARNWVWEHALSSGATKHWILDDNIDGFYRLNQNKKEKVVDENPFIPIEQFVERFSNVAFSGMNYEFFVLRRAKYPPFYLNTRVYSCILIQNNAPYRWRGRYNEDTDLCLRALKDGWCTVLFNAYLAKKMPTMTMKGGNTDELYRQDEKMDGRRLMAESLKEQHPDVTTVTHKWGRWQHHVDYRPFRRNKLKEKKDED